MNRKMDRYIETGRVEKERKRYRKKESGRYEIKSRSDLC